MNIDIYNIETNKVLLSLASAVIALSAALAAYLYTRYKDRRERIDLQIKYFDSFRKWADKAIDDLSEAVHLCDLDPNKVIGEPFFDRLHRLRISISSLIDKGRFFLPNNGVEDYGRDKDIGFKGYRHEILDALVEAYRLLNKMDYASKANNVGLRVDLVTAKRAFAGNVQEVLDPSGSKREFDRIIKRVHHRA